MKEKAAAEVLLELQQLLRRCSTASQVKQLHAHLITTTTNQNQTTSRLQSLLHALVRTYNATGCLTHAVLLFDRSPPPSHSNILWNVLIRSSSQHHSINLFRRMMLHSVSLPDNYTFTFTITASSKLPNPLPTVQTVHSLTFKYGCSADCDVFVGNALIAAYSVASRVEEDALKVFDDMTSRDVVTWTTLIDGYAGIGRLDAANALFQQMPDRNDVSWAVIVSGHVAAGMYEDALQLFHRMLRCNDHHWTTNEAILVSALSACSQMGALEQGKWIHAYIDKISSNITVFWSSNVSTALIDMYARCGRINCANQVFDNAFNRDVWTWTSMITGLAMHGLGEDALRIFRQMIDEGVRPDAVTIVAVLKGCSHSGLVKEGTSIFYSMGCLWGIVPEIEHYGCLIDLLGRAGQLDRAFQTIMNMPISPDLVTWRPLLSACRIHGDVSLAELVFTQIAKIDPTGQTEARVLLSNMYASMDRWEGVSSSRSSITNGSIGSQTKPGCSWIEVNGTVHKFLASERLHPQITQVKNMLARVVRRVTIEGGYVVNTRNVLFDLSEEEREQAVSWHSEKLALAFGLMNTEEGCSIRIMKNLRICEDCHAMMKSVSQVFCREIVVRDRSRFHRFFAGDCSCKDYW